MIITLYNKKYNVVFEADAGYAPTLGSDNKAIRGSNTIDESSGTWDTSGISVGSEYTMDIEGKDSGTVTVTKITSSRVIVSFL